MIKEIIIGSGIGLMIFLIILGVDVFPVVFIGLLVGALYAMFRSQLGGDFKGNTPLSNRVKTGITFDDIGGQDTAINEIKEALEFLLKPAAIVKMGIRPLKGILLSGPPGTGKTLLARAAASYTRSSFISASGSEFIEVYAGVGARRVRQLFSDARKKAKKEGNNSAIIFIDELEILGAKRGSHQSHMEYDQTLNQLLVEMDGLSGDEETRLLVVGATNRADMLDSALTRPGRFDRQVIVSLPDKRGRASILTIHTRNKPMATDVSIESLAKATFGFSGAQLESLANEAAILALRDNKEDIDNRYFMEAIDKVILGEKLDRKPSENETKRVSIHEFGHALVSELTKPGSVSSLTIVPRGQALGFMRKNTPEHDQYLYTNKEMKGQIMVALAGAVAEELCLGERSTGARNDFEQAWDVAREIVKCGLSKLGAISGEDIPNDLIFNECSAIISDMETETRKMLQDKKDLLEIAAARLLEEETLDRMKFLDILKTSA
ncbi:MAG: AAA family ATPase [Chitinophagales bacterium]